MIGNVIQSPAVKYLMIDRYVTFGTQANSTRVHECSRFQTAWRWNLIDSERFREKSENSILCSFVHWRNLNKIPPSRKKKQIQYQCSEKHFCARKWKQFSTLRNKSWLCPTLLPSGVIGTINCRTFASIMFGLLFAVCHFKQIIWKLEWLIVKICKATWQ